MGQTKTAKTDDAVAALCPQCAMCCNGVLFKDVELQPGDDAGTLKSFGLPFARSGKEKFPQPCAALDGCRCRIYTDRPQRCRQFECALLQAVMAGETETPAALKVIRKTQKRAEKVRQLLRATGDENEALALSLRFKRVQRQAENGAMEADAFQSFGELTLAMHDLNLLLAEKFYPEQG